MSRAPKVAIEDRPEPDRVTGAAHPRETQTLIGQTKAEAAFLDAYRAGKLHHGWMITGALGLGKATLAWKIARFLLATPEDASGMFATPPPNSLDIPADHPVSHRLAALSEPRLFLLRRAWDDSARKLKSMITVDEVRKMKSYFALSAADGGRRVAIIDAVDDMNIQAANALLKLLEEPPPNVILLLVSHQPSKLLPTIRSRCRELRLSPLAAADMATALAVTEDAPSDPVPLAELSGGSVGEAVRILNLDGLKLYAGIVSLFATLPRLDRSRALALSELGAGRGNEEKFDLLLMLIDLFLARMARAGTLGYCPPEAAKGEAELIARLSPTPDAARHWADLAQGLANRARKGRAVNLDPAALLMDMVLKIDETAGMLAQR
jgi:DNA polymerase III subunit delta'